MPNIITGIWTFDDPDSYDPTGLNFNAAVQVKDLRSHDPNKSWHLYKNARAFSAS